MKTIDKPKKEMLILAVFFIVFGILWVLLTERSWFSIIVHIRESIYHGDNGKLMLASATMSLLMAVPSITFYIGVVLSVDFINAIMNRSLKYEKVITIISFTMIHWTVYEVLRYPKEPLTVLMGALITTLLLAWSSSYKRSLISSILIVIQVFYAAQWFNVMPVLTRYYIGVSDVSQSIKITASYLNGEAILHYLSLAFALPLMGAALLTAMFFRVQSQNLEIIEENYQKARHLETMQSQLMKNRLYQEINALAHDLKTPLVTVRGLNSLMTLSRDVEKIDIYASRIEGALEKMNDMISSFLYATSKQKISIDDLINYMRAQIPIEDELLLIDIQIDKDLPVVYVNKVRVVRALVNIVENAIIVPTLEERKIITIEAVKSLRGVLITISDNGEGICTNELEKVWEIGHSSRRTSGLGLPFAKQILEENAGSICLDSEIGKGTRVYVELEVIRHEEK